MHLLATQDKTNLTPVFTSVKKKMKSIFGHRAIIILGLADGVSQEQMLSYRCINALTPYSKMGTWLLLVLF